MTFTVTNRNGQMLADPPADLIEAVLDELDGPDDPEHPDVSLSHESEWSLSAFPGGLVVFENVEEGEPRHMRGIERSHLEQLWAALATGDLATLENERWLPGYG